MCCVLFFVCLYLRMRMCTSKQIQQIFMCIVGVPLSQALPGFLITAPPSVCVPDVMGVLAV